MLIYICPFVYLFIFTFIIIIYKVIFIFIMKDSFVLIHGSCNCPMGINKVFEMKKEMKLASL